MAREVVLGFLWLASLIAEVASLAFVAKGARINDMKNGWNPALLEKLWTLTVRSSAKIDRIIIPSITYVMALIHAHIDLSTTALLCLSSTTMSASSQVLHICTNERVVKLALLTLDK